MAAAAILNFRKMSITLDWIKISCIKLYGKMHHGHVRSLLTDDVTQTVACSIVASRLDYCNALLSGAPATAFDKLQRAQNNLARVDLSDYNRYLNKNI